MDTQTILSRRQLLKAAPVVAIVAATPTVALASPAEAPTDRLSALMEEISEILDDALMGTFCAIIEPSRHDRAIVALKPIRDVRAALATAAFLKNASHNDLVQFHLSGTAKAIHAEHGGCWIARAERGGSVTIRSHPDAADGCWLSFPIGA